MKSPLILPAPAKLNLFLHITGQRKNGYHELQTVFQIIDYCDQLTFTPTLSPEISIVSNTNDIAPQDNLIWRAADLLKQKTACTQGANIKLNKIIPMGGGLGGGSSDAATTLIGLNQCWDTGLTVDQLIDIGRTLGADIPVFIKGNSAWAEGIGDQLSDLELPELWFLVLTPDCHVETKAIFSHKDLTRDSKTIRMADFLAERSWNDCEAVVTSLYSEVDQALKLLKTIKADARMTGTGACVFCSFQHKHDALEALEITKHQVSGFVAKGLNQSPLQKKLALSQHFNKKRG